MTRDVQAIINAISKDATRPTTRQALVDRLGICDRSVRRKIEEARRAGVWIVGLLSGGYYITEDAEEWNRFCMTERRRAVATFKRQARVQDERQVSMI